MRSMLESTKELEEKKRTLEQTQDSLNEELVKLRAQGKNQSDPDPSFFHQYLIPFCVHGYVKDQGFSCCLATLRKKSHFEYRK
jgi:hypothetical protein